MPDGSLLQAKGLGTGYDGPDLVARADAAFRSKQRPMTHWEGLRRLFLPDAPPFTFSCTRCATISVSVSLTIFAPPFSRRARNARWFSMMPL